MTWTSLSAGDQQPDGGRRFHRSGDTCRRLRRLRCRTGQGAERLSTAGRSALPRVFVQPCYRREACRTRSARRGNTATPGTDRPVRPRVWPSSAALARCGAETSGPRRRPRSRRRGSGEASAAYCSSPRVRDGWQSHGWTRERKERRPATSRPSPHAGIDLALAIPLTNRLRCPDPSGPAPLSIAAHSDSSNLPVERRLGICRSGSGEMFVLAWRAVRPRYVNTLMKQHVLAEPVGAGLALPPSGAGAPHCSAPTSSSSSLLCADLSSRPFRRQRLGLRAAWSASPSPSAGD